VGDGAQKNRRAGSLRRLFREVADRVDLQAFLSSAGDREPKIKAESGDGLAHHIQNIPRPRPGTCRMHATARRRKRGQNKSGPRAAFVRELAEWTATQNAPQSMSQGVTGYYQIMKAPNCVVLLSPIAPHPVPAAAMGALMGCTTPRTGLCVREGQANQEIRSAASINFRMHHWSRSESLSVASTITCSPPFCSVIV